MNQAEFQTQVNRLSNTFGKTHFGSERLMLLWKRVQSFSSAWFQRTIDDLISTHRQPPLPNDFETAISMERERLWKEQKGETLYEIQAGYSCTTCKDTGVYVCHHPARGGMWGFRCPCQKGDADPRQAIPQYKQSHQDEGFFWLDMPTYKPVSA